MRMSLSLAGLLLTSTLVAATVWPDETIESLQHLISNARTKADQEKIAGIFAGQAIRDRDEAAKHYALADFYKGRESRAGRGTTSYPMEPHCRALGDYYSKAAEENDKLAEMHRKMAAEMK